MITEFKMCTNFEITSKSGAMYTLSGHRIPLGGKVIYFGLNHVTYKIIQK